MTPEQDEALTTLDDLRRHLRFLVAQYMEVPIAEVGRVPHRQFMVLVHRLLDEVDEELDPSWRWS